MSYLSIRVEGGLLSPDFLERIHEAAGQGPADFGLDSRGSIVDEVSAAWGDARAYWEAFQRRVARARSGRRDREARAESLTTITREGWIIPLLETLNYSVTFQRRASEVGGRTYAISHRAGEDETAPPVHIVAIDQDLGSRPAAGRGTMSPHALMQDYLNRSDDHLWGVVTNGEILRLLRDSTYFTRPAYIEFDLRQMLEGERLDEFFLLYRLAHRSRLPRPDEVPSECLLESYYQDTLEQGGRIRDGLRETVSEAIITLANGFLQHPRNTALRKRLRTGKLTAEELYRQLLYLIYRFLFLMVAEERNILAGEGSSDEYYRRYFSISRLSRLVDEPLNAPQRFDDLYMGLRTLFRAFHDEKMAAQLGVPPLNGKLFERLSDLDNVQLTNRDLLQAIRLMSYFTPKDEKVRRRVNYAALDVEELGSVYESLLEEHPVINEEAGHPTFDFVTGTERKTTGSYYTPRELVTEVIKSALVPVIEDRLERAGSSTEAKVRALLDLDVCDPACGSGHFLLAAARRIGYELAKVRSGEDEPSPRMIREGTREAITHCIYGVDKNPLAVDLCRVALWIEGHSRGKPLTFLNHRIRPGDSLVGVFDLDVLEDGIPGDAYKPVSGDDKKVAMSVKSRNQQERAGQMSFHARAKDWLSTDQAAARWERMEKLPEDTPEQVDAKKTLYQQLKMEETDAFAAANLWTAAFFAPLTEVTLKSDSVPTTDVLRRYLSNPKAVSARIVGLSLNLAEEYRFFHWPLEFPQVNTCGGFDVVLGNPPWDIIQLDKTRKSELPYYKLKEWYKLGQYAILKGRRDFYKLFIARAKDLVGPEGRLGFVVPFGMFVEDDSINIRRELYLNGSVLSMQHFQNRQKKFFPNVDSRYRFVSIIYTPSPDADHQFSTVVDLPNTLGKEFWVTVARDVLEKQLGESVAAVLYPDRAYAELHSLLMDHLEELPAHPFDVVAEFHATTDKALMSQQRRFDTDWQMLKNRSIHQFNHRFGEGGKYISERAVEERCMQKGVGSQIWIGSKPRLLFRDIARNDDARTLICCLAAPGFVSSYDTPMVLPAFDKDHDLGTLLAYFCGIFNSFVFDFLIRAFVDKHIKGYILKRLSVPRYDPDNPLMRLVAKEAMYLSRVYPSKTCDESVLLEHRAQIDAAVAHLLGLKAEKLGFVMDTFPIIQREQNRVFGEYLSRRLTLEAWYTLATARETDMSGANLIERSPSGAEPKAESPSSAIRVRSHPLTQSLPARPQAKSPATPKAQRPTATKSAKQLVLPRVHLPDLGIASEGTFNQRLKRVQTLDKNPSPTEIAELVVYLAAPENSLRWLARATLSNIGGVHVAAAVKALLEKEIPDEARQEALKLLSDVTGDGIRV